MASKSASKKATPKSAMPKQAPPVTQVASKKEAKKTYTLEEQLKKARATNDSVYTGEEAVKPFDGISLGNKNTQNRVVSQGDVMHERSAHKK